MHITQLLPSIVNYFIRTLSIIEKTYESIWMLPILVVNMRYCTFVFLCMFFMRVKSLQMANDRVCILSIIIFCFFLCGKQKTINEYKWKSPNPHQHIDLASINTYSILILNITNRLNPVCSKKSCLELSSYYIHCTYLQKYFTVQHMIVVCQKISSVWTIYKLFFLFSVHRHWKKSEFGTLWNSFIKFYIQTYFELILVTKLTLEICFCTQKGNGQS